MDLLLIGFLEIGDFQSVEILLPSPPQEHLAMLGDIFGCHTGGMLLLSSGQKPGMKLSILHCALSTWARIPVLLLLRIPAF